MNASFEDLGDSGVTFDDYKPFHGSNFRTEWAGLWAEHGTVYYYKIRVTDPSNNTGQSACLNFTTKTRFKKVNFDVDLDAGYTVDLQMSNGSYITQNWNGTYMIKLNTSVSKSMNLTVKCNSGNYQMKFVGVDVNSRWTLISKIS